MDILLSYQGTFFKKTTSREIINNCYSIKINKCRNTRKLNNAENMTLKKAYNNTQILDSIEKEID